MEFRNFVWFSEATFAPKQFNKYGIGTQNTVRKNYNGWDIIFWNRLAQKHDPKMVAFATWIVQGDESGETIGDQNPLVKAIDNVFERNKDEFADTIQQIRMAQHHNSMGEEGYSTKVLRPDTSHRYFKRWNNPTSDQKMLDKIRDIDQHEMDQEVWDGLKDVFQDYYTADRTEDDHYWGDNRDLFKQLANLNLDDREERKRVHKELSDFYREVQKQVFDNVLTRHGFAHDEKEYLYDFLEKETSSTEQFKSHKLPYNLELQRLHRVFREDGIRTAIAEVMKAAYNDVMWYFKKLSNAMKPLKGFDQSKLALGMADAAKELTDQVLRTLTVLWYNYVKKDPSKTISADELIKLVGDTPEQFDYKGKSWEDIIDTAGKSRHFSDDNILWNAFGYHIKEHILKTLNDFHYYTNDKEIYDKDFIKFQQKALEAVKYVTAALMTLGVRNFHRVPLLFCFQNWSEPSGYGDETAIGHAFPDHIRVYGDLSVPQTVSVLSHEIGHVVFNRLTFQQQQAIGQLSQSGVYPSDYGKPSYVFKGTTEPSKGHKTGNEWLATVIEYLAKHPGYNHYKAPEAGQEKTWGNAILSVKKIVAGVANYGTGYKNQQNPQKLMRAPRRLEPRKVPKPEQNSGQQT